MRKKRTYLGRAIYKNCIVCGKTYYCIRSRVKTSNYCSNKCWHKIHIGKNHPTWRGGTKNWAGYRLISVYGKQVREHRYLMEQHIGRKLQKNEVVHHINGDRADNRIENLEVKIKNLHDKEHTIGSKNPFYGKRHTKETKEKISKAKKGR